MKQVDQFAVMFSVLLTCVVVVSASSVCKAVSNLSVLTSEGVSEPCRTHSRLYESGVKRGERWAHKMFDASSKLPHHILQRGVMDIGRYDECVSVRGGGGITGRHCLVTMGSPGWTLRIRTLQRMQGHTEELQDRLAGRWEEAHVEETGLMWGLCVPSSCQPADVRRHLETVLPTVMPANLTVISSIVCSSPEDIPPFSVGDWLFASLILMVLGLCGVATWRHCSSALPDGGALSAFSLKRGMQQLLDVSACADRLPALDGLRVIGMMSLFFYHFGIFYDYGPLRPNISFAEDLKLQRGRMTAALHVETFLLVSGVLVCYNKLRELKSGSAFNLVSFYCNRLVRIAPVFWFLIIFMISGLIHRVSEGPFLGENIMEQQGSCLRNYPQSLMFVGNFLPIEEICIFHTWYLSVDMQLFWLSPLFIYFLHKVPRLGLAMIGGMLQVDLAIRYYVTSRYDDDFFGMAFSSSTKYGWYQTYNRLFAWFTGMGLGYLLHVTRHMPVRLSRAAVTAAWTLSGLAITTALLRGPEFFASEKGWLRLGYAVLHRPVWDVALAWVVFACTRGHGGMVNSVLSWRGFLIPSRLSFCFYVLHALVIGFVMMSARSLEQPNGLTWVTRITVNLVLSFTCALGAHLLLELPAISLWKMWLRKESPKNKIPSRGKEE